MKKKKYEIIIRYVHENLFNADFVLVLSKWEHFIEGAKEFLSPEKLKALEKMVKERGDDKWCLATQFPFEGGGSIIWANPKATVGILVHEVVHAALHLLKKRATPLSEDTEETYAYLIQYLFEALTAQKKRS